jgi:hypothetical protein
VAIGLRAVGEGVGDGLQRLHERVQHGRLHVVLQVGSRFRPPGVPEWGAGGSAGVPEWGAGGSG